MLLNISNININRICGKLEYEICGKLEYEVIYPLRSSKHIGMMMIQMFLPVSSFIMSGWFDLSFEVEIT